MNRAEALKTVASESERIHAVRTERHKEDDWVKLRPSSIYVWELVISRTDVGVGYTNHRKWSQFYTTKELAQLAAWKEIQGYFGTWGSDYLEKYKKKWVDKGDYEGCLKEFSSQHGSLYFEITEREIIAESDGEPTK